MKRALFFLVLCLFTACSLPSGAVPATGQPLPQPTQPSPEPTAMVPIEPSPTSAPRNLGTVNYYRIRVQYSTTSDWSTFEWLDPSGILTMNSVEVTGDPTNVVTGVEQLALNQPLKAAQTGSTVGMTVDYAFSAEALGEVLKFRIKKGDIGSSIVGLVDMTPWTPQVIQSVERSGVDPHSAGSNSMDFSINISALKNVAPNQAEVRSRVGEKLVWAFFYPWYSASDWSSPVLKDHPLDRYTSSSRETIAKQVDQAQSAGIDGFISSWWGPASYTDQNLPKLLDIAQEKNFRVCIYFETLAGQNGSPLAEADIQRWLEYAIQHYGQHPAYMRVDGKPVIVIWASDTVPTETWKRIFATLRSEALDAVFIGMGYSIGNLGVFDGLHEYGVFTFPDLNGLYQSTQRAVRYYPLLAPDSTPKLWIATVQPGYDDTLQPDREGLVQARNNGEYYRSTWEAALASDPDWIFITTWNEWYEHTNIEPGELYGDQYLGITKEYADRYKQK